MPDRQSPVPDTSEVTSPDLAARSHFLACHALRFRRRAPAHRALPSCERGPVLGPPKNRARTSHLPRYLFARCVVCHALGFRRGPSLATQTPQRARSVPRGSLRRPHYCSPLGSIQRLRSLARWRSRPGTVAPIPADKGSDGSCSGVTLGVRRTPIRALAEAVRESLLKRGSGHRTPVRVCISSRTRCTRANLKGGSSCARTKTSRGARSTSKPWPRLRL